MNVGAVVRLSRPFTLLAPALGMVAGSIAAIGYDGRFEPTRDDWTHLALGALMAALLNVASNAVNQIFDLEVDRINKPDRPLPAGELSIAQAAAVTVLAYAASLAVAWAVNTTLFAIVALTAVLTFLYSGPPVRSKRHWALANVTIAIPRGFLLPVAGWAAILGGTTWREGLADLPTDAWVFATASGLFILGAASTKDYADLEGDRAGGCITLPLRFGVRRSVWMVAPFLAVPWLLLPVARLGGWMTGNAFVLVWGGLALTAIGARAAWLLVRDPEALTDGSTHPAWVLMYLLMLASQAVIALGYALPHDLLSGLVP